MAAAIVVAGGAVVWIAGWPARLLVEPVVAAVLVLLVVAGHLACFDLLTTVLEEH